MPALRGLLSVPSHQLPSTHIHTRTEYVAASFYDLHADVEIDVSDVTHPFHHLLRSSTDRTIRLPYYSPGGLVELAAAVDWSKYEAAPLHLWPPEQHCPECDEGCSRQEALFPHACTKPGHILGPSRVHANGTFHWSQLLLLSLPCVSPHCCMSFPQPLSFTASSV
jgi:hypothetical protein